MKKWKCKKSKLILDTKFLKVRKDVVELPGKEVREWIYWDSRDSVMVLGLTPESKLVMTRQYRYLANQEVLDFPAGGLLVSEDIETGAKRELKEETGYKATSSLVKLGSFYETYGQLNRRIHIFFARNVKRSKTGQNLDRGKRGFEQIKVELVNFDEAVKMARDNKIICTPCALAVLLLKEKIEKRGK